MTKLFGIPSSMTEQPLPYCPGCTHGIAHRLLGEGVDNLGNSEKMIGIVSAGCSVRSWKLYRFDMVLCAHGRAPAVATGLKRALPDTTVFCYQGDGDSTAIGLAELMHAAIRCEKITVFMINNAVYGATGGQAAPTTVLGQATTSYPTGRDPNYTGYPINMAEIIAQISKNCYSARVSLDNVQNVLKAKETITRAFQTQKKKLGFSFIEMLSTCPTGWHKTPLESIEMIRKKLIPQYPLGEFSVPEDLQ